MMENEKVYLEKINELIDEVIHKEQVINKLVRYIARNSKTTSAICEKNKLGRCYKENCLNCIREYAERRF